jgi:hypothetical protein
MPREFTVALDPGIADILRTKASLPHQMNPPSSWFALEYLFALQLGNRLAFSDGRTLWLGPDDAWRFADHPELARIIAAAGSKTDPVQGTPRAAPLGAVGGDSTLWVLRWFDRDHRQFVGTPFVLDLTRREVRVLRTGDRPIPGTAPKRLLALGVEGRFAIEGDVDAGAMAHLDDFIMVDVAWEVDLAQGSYHYVQSPVRGTPTTGLVAIGPGQMLTRDGLVYTAISRVLEFDGEAGKWMFAARTGDEVLLLDLHAFDRATVSIVDHATAAKMARK